MSTEDAADLRRMSIPARPQYVGKASDAFVDQLRHPVVATSHELVAAHGFDERQPLSIPSMGAAKKNFRSPVVLARGRQALRTAQPPRGQRRDESGGQRPWLSGNRVPPTGTMMRS